MGFLSLLPPILSSPGPKTLSDLFYLTSITSTLIATLLYLSLTQVRSKPSRRHSAILLVLGDIGRSPRMMYHAESLAKHGWETFLVGYDETTPIPALLDTPHIHLSGIANPPNVVLRLPWAIRAPIRVMVQVISVLWICLWRVPVRSEVFMIQNPPSIPTLALAQLICWITGAKLIIDWHNTGYSILAMRVGQGSVLVKVAKWFERRFGRKAWAHLFVTRAMEEFLVKEWGLLGKRVVLHDRPPGKFSRTEPMAQHELFQRLQPTFNPPLPPYLLSNPFTQPKPGLPTLNPSRPALLISSTSWTPDEDFTPLLTALDLYQLHLSTGRPLPKLLVLVTGKGALRQPFETAVLDREKRGIWKDVGVRCLFLPARDYPKLLGCADLGISLHASSSGRDLPMKVVDMFGCGVPVLARDFECLGELVKDGRNGRVFRTGEELGEQIMDILSGYPNSTKLSDLRAYFETEKKSGSRRGTPVGFEEEEEWSTWSENWDRMIYKGLLQSPRA